MRSSLGNFSALAGAAFLLILLPLAAFAEAPVVQHHDLQIELRPGTRSLRGVDTITGVRGTAGRALFELNPNSRIEAVRVGGRRVSYRFSDGRLEIPLDPGAAAAGRRIEVAYRCRFADRVPKTFLGGEDPGYGVVGTISRQGTLLLPAAAWYPAVSDVPASFQVTVAGPAGLLAVTAGELQDWDSGPDHCRTVWKVLPTSAVLPLAAGPYRVRAKRLGTVMIYTFLYPGSEDLADSYLAATARYVNLYQDLFGPFPYPKYAVVENFFPTGYGFPSFALLGSRVLRLPFILGTSLGHEVAHSWWGNCVTVAAGSGNWSEGLTTYVADHYYKEQASPAEARANRHRVLEDYASLVSERTDFPLRLFSQRRDPATRVIGYGKSAMVFHMLRRKIGETAFWQALRDLYQGKRCGPAGWQDFRAAFEKTSGRSLGTFFRQWLDRAGAPSLKLGAIHLARDAGGWRVEGALLQKGPVYDLAVPLSVATEGSEQQITVPLTGARQDFSIRTQQRPRLLTVDPMVDIFRRLAPEEVPVNVNSVKGSRSLLAVMSETTPPVSRSAAEQLLAALGRSGTEILPESKLSRSILKRHDILLLGLPGKSLDLIPVDRDGRVRLADSPAGETAELCTRGKTLFAVFPHPMKPGGVVALFCVGEDSGTLDTIGKIPHYGRYGLLLFHQARIQEKWQWPITRSPLVHPF